ncbi:5-oxoprolinase subunit PxpB [Flavimarina sp. Hel_I_48]|uniref:5-oxoprolinase subunit PxpB n=1 Tax=Flavimarina sp. Hel_I_48 TaxID=1392488 RepID=UPI0004DF55AA|nr:5-oxoprolinase subunit PxpB [Flavimarina sp. Hel_I_48]
MAKKPQISRFGDRGILMQWDFDFSPENLKILLSAKAKIASLLQPEVEVVNTYTSVLVRYPHIINSRDTDLKALQKLNFDPTKDFEVEQRVVELPVCYDSHFGLDLEFLAKEKKQSIDSLIRLHTAPVYTVYFIGFLPGFPYLGGLDERLAFPRKKEPRSRIEKGAVGIAENQTGIYPTASPAGWQIIGNCPLTLFDPNVPEPCLLKAGDQIRFKEVDIEAHARIKNAVENGNYELNIEENG